MALRALVAVLFLIFAAVPSGACCAPRVAEAAMVDHSRHGAPDRPAHGGHPAPAFVCVTFCAASPAPAIVLEPLAVSAIETERRVDPAPESFEGRPTPPPPRRV